MNKDQKDKLIESNVSVNGKPARIIGQLCEFPTVYIIEEPHNSREYTWETVQHIVNSGGQFHWATN